MLKLKNEEKNKSKARIISRFFLIWLILVVVISNVACTKNKDNDISQNKEEMKITPTYKNEIVQPSNIEFTQTKIKVNGRSNMVSSLFVDLAKKNVRVLPYLSFNKIYGFETLSDMAKREGAKAAITSGFFYMYGRPSGLVVNNGEILSAGTGRFSSLIIEKNKAYFKKINTKITAKIENSEILTIDTLNAPIEGNIQSALYTKTYGNTDRLHFKHTVIHIIGNNVVSIKTIEDEGEIPKEGFILAFRHLPTYISIKPNDFMQVSITPSFDIDVNAYECSKMIVKDGINVATEYDPWIGNVNQYDPRTCVGTTKDGNIIFIVVDGRQNEYSSGVTAKELADICINMKLVDAAMLDGGASAEILIDGQVKNRLSYNNEQRLLAGGFLIFVD